MTSKHRPEDDPRKEQPDSPEPGFSYEGVEEETPGMIPAEPREDGDHSEEETPQMDPSAVSEPDAGTDELEPGATRSEPELTEPTEQATAVGATALPHPALGGEELPPEPAETKQELVVAAQETSTTEMLSSIENQVETLCTQMSAGFDKLDATIASVRDEDIAAVKKQISFVPPKMRSVEDKVMMLRDAISESKYRDLLKDLLRVHDLIDQIIAGLVIPSNCTEMEKQKRNYEVLKTQIRQILAVHGLTEIDTSGAFDPKLHQATGKMETEDPEQDGKIAKVRRPGFKTEGAVLRYAECDIYSLVSGNTKTDETRSTET